MKLLPTFEIQELIEDIQQAIILLDQEGFISYLNPAAEVLTGFSKRELLNKYASFIYSQENGAEEKIRYDLHLGKKKGEYVTEGWRTQKDGTRYWGELTINTLYHEKSFIGYSLLLRDISERKALELDLRKSEERYRLMVEGVRDYAIFMLDPKGYILTWNDGAQYTKGYSANEIIGRHFSTFYTAEDLEDGKPARELKIAIATGKYEEEGWRVKKDGSVFWANIVITSLYNEQNELIGFSKVTRNLTERKQNEENLRQSEERYRSLVEQISDYGIFMMDEKGRIISWNEGARKIKGYEAGEIIGKYFSIFYPEEDILNGKPQYELKVAQKEGKYEEEGWRLRKDRTKFWANIIITAIYNNKGILIGYSKITRDLTERKEAERALRESHDNYRLLADQLKQTNTQLTYANQELEQFTSIVSHDLQEPIRTIKSFLQLIDMKLDEGQSNELKNYIGKSIQAATRMRELIQNLLNYSQLSKGQIVEEEVKVDDLINEALQNLKSSVEVSKVTITIHNEVEKVSGDRVQLVQLLQNLLSNALKFTEANDPQVRIRCIKEKGYIKFSVSDNGIGMEEGDLSKIFEIFKRLNTKKEYPGTGIGLAICQKIVERHKGRIWPESKPGQGTTFYFTLHEGIQQKLSA